MTAETSADGSWTTRRGTCPALREPSEITHQVTEEVQLDFAPTVPRHQIYCSDTTVSCMQLCSLVHGYPRYRERGRLADGSAKRLRLDSKLSDKGPSLPEMATNQAEISWSASAIRAMKQS